MTSTGEIEEALQCRELAMWSFRTIADSFLGIGRLNLITGVFEVIKREEGLPTVSGTQVGRLQDYIEAIVDAGLVHPDYLAKFRFQVDLANLRYTLFATGRMRTFTFQEAAERGAGWLTVGAIPCAGCSEENPYAVIYIHEELEINLPTAVQRRRYEHDSLTGLFSRGKFDADLRDLVTRRFASISAVYVDVIGLHEVNNHIGHEGGDDLLRQVADAARKSFPDSYLYRIGGDEFVVLTPDQSAEEAQAAALGMREALKADGFDVSIGVSEAKPSSDLPLAIKRAETAMRTEKRAFYQHDGKHRQLRVLDDKLEHILQEKRDIEQFVRLFVPEYTGVYVVDMAADSMRCIVAPPEFAEMLAEGEGSFLEGATGYVESTVAPEYQASILELFDYARIRKMLSSGSPIERRYLRNEGHGLRMRIIRYSDKASESNLTIWVFSRISPKEVGAPYVTSASSR